jgi:hypothetical protein
LSWHQQLFWCTLGVTFECDICLILTTRGMGMQKNILKVSTLGLAISLTGSSLAAGDLALDGSSKMRPCLTLDTVQSQNNLVALSAATVLPVVAGMNDARHAQEHGEWGVWRGLASAGSTLTVAMLVAAPEFVERYNACTACGPVKDDSLHPDACQRLVIKNAVNVGMSLASVVAFCYVSGRVFVHKRILQEKRSLKRN